MADIAILGYGIVGSGVAEVIEKNYESILARCGEGIKVKRILDIRDFSGPHSSLRTGNPEDIFNDKDIRIVVETIGGTGIAYEYTKRALSSGRHVVTSNKELVATKGPELLQLAHDNHVTYMFEASVGGGIPIIRPLHQCLSANRIIGIMGILNGTTNYILTRIRQDGTSFESALKNAQTKGYAEANPNDDIKGHDTCRKLAILSSIAFNEYVDYRKIQTEGITELSKTDMDYAEEMDSVIKLIGIAKRKGDDIYCKVAPAILQKNHALAPVEDVFNAIVIEGDVIGDAMFYGRGAGKLPTASAVAADIIDIVNHIDSNGKSVWKVKEPSGLAEPGNFESAFFVRVGTENRDCARDCINNIFGDVNYIDIKREGEAAFTTGKDKESVIKSKLAMLSEFSCIKEIISTIMVMDGGNGGN